MQCRAREERPGRKTDLLDAEWLVHLLECGLLRGWLIPPADIKAARDVIRYRRKLVEHRTSKLQRLGNVLQDAGIKADSVASSVTPKSVRAMVEALIDGERRPAVLADLARGSMRSKIPDLQRALEGRFDDHHALMCRLHLAHLDHRSNSRLPTTLNARDQPPAEVSDQRVSGLTGAVQFGERDHVSDKRCSFFDEGWVVACKANFQV